VQGGRTHGLKLWLGRFATVRSVSHLGGALHPIPIHRRFTPTGSCKSDARIRSNDAGSGEGSGGPELDGWQTREPIHDEVGCLSGSVAARETAAEGKGRVMKRDRASPGKRLRRGFSGCLGSNCCVVRLMRQTRECERAGKVGGAHAQRLACVRVTSRRRGGSSPTLRTESVLGCEFLLGRTHRRLRMGGCEEPTGAGPMDTMRPACWLTRPRVPQPCGSF
jgi:hypothetical protein